MGKACENSIRNNNRQYLWKKTRSLSQIINIISVFLTVSQSQLFNGVPNLQRSEFLEIFETENSETKSSAEDLATLQNISRGVTNPIRERERESKLPIHFSRSVFQTRFGRDREQHARKRWKLLISALAKFDLGTENRQKSPRFACSLVDLTLWRVCPIEWPFSRNHIPNPRTAEWSDSREAQPLRETVPAFSPQRLKEAAGGQSSRKRVWNIARGKPKPFV